MTPTLAVFGAGPALGLSVARRFGSEGYQVALVARDRTKLDRLEEALRAERVSAYSVTTDLTDLVQVRAAAAAIADRFGTPDVVLYAPGDTSRLPVGTLELNVEELQTWLPLHLYSPIALANAMLPGMLERGSGALLYALGASARQVMPPLASVGVPQAGLLSYLNGLAAEVAGRGVFVGSMLIGALIEHSAASALWDTGHFDGVQSGAIPRVEPDVLAARYWEMVRDRDQHEVLAA
ncbi:MAG TPA: SDR family oxidoreductase [Pseudonocardia sp.]|uniref:SDR family oxidoreductase n=1 Tax=Pseudonocardia sp. TaxID=60912 RepID=UPI002C950AE8|nr:SDR family oxidoreductase [Pseudonocardia sp.]HTF55112.1 SDR family oxidoreductase [Pseudonocardia sp.]